MVYHVCMAEDAPEPFFSRREVVFNASATVAALIGGEKLTQLLSAEDKEFRDSIREEEGTIVEKNTGDSLFKGLYILSIKTSVGVKKVFVSEDQYLTITKGQKVKIRYSTKDSNWVEIFIASWSQGAS